MKEFSKCTVAIGNFSTIVKARILYNHLYVNEIPIEYLMALNFRAINIIIGHKNFNPRIVEYFTKSKFWNKYTINNFSDRFIELFDDPYLVWQHSFDTEISDLSKMILLNLLITGDPIEYKILYNQMKTYVRNNKSEVSFTLNNFSFNISLRELVNSFIKITKESDLSFIGFQNPSIIDFLMKYLSKNPILKIELINSITYIKNLTSIFNYYGGNRPGIPLSKQEKDILNKYVAENYQNLEYEPDFFLDYLKNDVDREINKLRYCVVVFNNFDKQLILSRLKRHLYSNRITTHSFLDFTILIRRYKNDLKIEPVKFLKNLMNNITNFGDAYYFMRLKKIFPEAYDNFRMKYNDEFNYMIKNIIELIISRNESDYRRICNDLSTVETLSGLSTAELQEKYKKKEREKVKEIKNQNLHLHSEVSEKTTEEKNQLSGDDNGPPISEISTIRNLFNSLKY